MTTTDDQETTSTDVATTADDPLAALMAYAQTIEPDDPEEVQRKILANILNAKNAEQLLNAGASIPGDDLINMPMRVTGIRAAESTMQDGMDMYLHVDATLLGNGDQVTFSTGARDVVVKLLIAAKNGWLPQDCKLVRSERATQAGYFPTFIRPLADDERPF